ncbi:MAG: sugar transferase [Lachnospiraceae bacterium]
MYRKKPQGWLKHLDFIVTDQILLQLAFVTAFILRFDASRLANLKFYSTDMILIAVGAVIDGILFESYKDILRRGYLIEFEKTVRMVVVDLLLLTFFLYVMKTGETLSRLMTLYFAICALCYVYLARCLRKYWLWHHRFPGGYSIRQLLIVADADKAPEIIHRVQENIYRDIQISGLIDTSGKAAVGDEIADAKVVTTLEKAGEYMTTRWIDEVLVCTSPENNPAVQRLLDLCSEMGITVHIPLSAPKDNYETHTIEKFCGFRVITESIRIVSTGQLMAKRAIDIIGSLVGLAFTGIFTVIFGPIIFFTDPGPIFYSQVRIGENGRRFRIYKFRSMYKDADKRKKELMEKNEMQGLMFKMENDPRILGSGPDGTRHGIGWFIRKTSIDEFPQFLNVFLGQMSLVGTRPPTEEEFQQYEAHHRARLATKPGITGLWQVSGRSKITDFEKVVELDMEYINTWTVREDFKILLKTVKAVFAGDGAE